MLRTGHHHSVKKLLDVHPMIEYITGCCTAKAVVKMVELNSSPADRVTLEKLCPRVDQTAGTLLVR